ncbi:MAG: hypothetical protein HKO71_01605 [Pseudomonadales bacterium]|nr:hypothetical protein [Gammaproteobacteria bacterium]NNL56423.1 hypothetical protein [Pseudomonadales bacterium]
MSDERKTRKSDSPLNDPVQSSRFVEIGGNWFFLTREKELQGPYASKTGAETALNIYLNEEVSSSPVSKGATPKSYPVEELDNNVLQWRKTHSQSKD